MLIFALLTFVRTIYSPELVSAAPPMLVECQNIQQARGNILIAVYRDQDTYMNDSKAVYKQVVPVSQQGVLQISVPGLGAGAYAVSCYHDVNGNYKLDKNMLGIPTEPYGSSNNARPKFRAPYWEEAKTWWNGTSEQKIALRLDTW